MKVYLVIEDWGDGVTAYPRSTRKKAEDTCEAIRAAQDAEYGRETEIVWIDEREMDAPCEDEDATTQEGEVA
jgi:hypothetical protein